MSTWCLLAGEFRDISAKSKNPRYYTWYRCIWDVMITFCTLSNKLSDFNALDNTRRDSSVKETLTGNLMA